MLARALIAIACLTSGCGRERSEAAITVEQRAVDQPAPREAASGADASDLIAKYECTRCHEVANVASAPRDKHCVTCHQQIHAGTFDRGDAAAHERWRGRIASLRFAPSLANADRLRHAWVRDFLLSPHDVRPGLVAQMPRLAISREDAERLANHLASRGGEMMSVTGDAKRGEVLYRSLACGRCHRFTGASVDDAAMHATARQQTQPIDGWALAPDLRHARARMTAGAIATWIAEPRGAMPKLGVALNDARSLAAYIATTPLAALSPLEAPKRLPLLERDVTWEEVEQRVFRHVCWHCHAVSELARGDGGPGNSGGFGFGPRGLDLSSYAGISAGSLDDAGERRSVFAKLPDGTPRIVAHLFARHVEESGGVIDGVRGMPLGLPAVPLEDIQLVETWIAQGRPR